MTGSWYRFKRAGIPLLLLCASLMSSGCATTGHHTGDLPPILTQDELLRPYQKVGVIEVTRERYGSPEDLTEADYNWGYQALRERAAKMGADAVIFPEVKTELETYIFFPSSEMKAKGVAIKFH
jgi:hypothetical protein